MPWGTNNKKRPFVYLYRGHIAHARYKPVRNAFRYRLFSFYINLEELPKISERLFLFSYNRPNVFSFYDKDHGPLDGTPVRQWATDQCAAQLGITIDTVHLLCFPRLFGYVFNPLSLFFCYEQGVLRAILYEVCNAFKQRHTYCLSVAKGNGGAIRHSMDKEFYVSPYMPLDCYYTCSLHEPGEQFTLRIEQQHKNEHLFTAVHEGRRQDLTNVRLFMYLLAYPLLTLAVTRRIWWQALLLFRKGLRFQKPPPREKVTVSAPDPSLTQKTP